MGGFLAWWRDLRRRRAEAATQRVAAKHAVALAKDAFVATYSNHYGSPHRGPIDIVDDGHIVMLGCQTRPTLWTVWHVDTAGLVRKLSLEEAMAHTNLPVLR